MARALRIEFPGAIYHIASRGNARQNIFLTASDREFFLASLGRVVSDSFWLCHGYCLMDNHYHLLVETPRANLANGMRRLNSTFAQGINRRHQRVGHLFQGRYRSVVVERQAHLLELARYVVLNPVRRELCTTPGEWRWSSYRATAGLEREPSFLNVDWILGQFGETRGEAQRRYRAFVDDGLGENPFKDVTGGIYLGSEEFIRRQAGEGRRIPEIPLLQTQPLRPSLNEIFEQNGESAVEIAYREYGYRLREIAAHQGVHPSTVSRRLRGLRSNSRARLQDPTPV